MNTRTRFFLPLFPALLLCLVLASTARADGYQHVPFTCVSGDCQNGQGVAQWSDGARYEGGFKEGQRHGKGTMTWPGGDRYAGDWELGLQHGHGTMTWATGARYIGQWNQGQRTGAGSLIYSSGKRIDGYFENGRLVDTVRVTDPVAARIEAEAKANKAKTAAPSSTDTASTSTPTTSTPTPTTTTTTSTTTTPAPATPPATGDVAAILVEVSSQGQVRFVNLYMGPSLAVARQTMSSQSLPPGYTGREVQSYQGPNRWVAQQGTYDDGGAAGFCYGAALGCSTREDCEAKARQAWSQAGCRQGNTTEGFSAYNDGAYHGLLPTGFPQIRTYH